MREAKKLDWKGLILQRWQGISRPCSKSNADDEPSYEIKLFKTRRTLDWFLDAVH
jgi:hypothetical protein